MKPQHSAFLHRKSNSLRGIASQKKLHWGLITICLLLYLGFGLIAHAAIGMDDPALDTKILLSLRSPDNVQSPIGPPWLEEMMRDFTALGGIALLTFITIGIAAYLLMIGRKANAVYLLSAGIIATISSNLLKITFDRPRPDIVPHDSIVYMASFPSGHSFLSTVIYLTIGAVLVETQTRLSHKIYILSLAALIPALIGISRIYLGVHWPSDVLAGWVMGALWR